MNERKRIINRNNENRFQPRHQDQHLKLRDENKNFFEKLVKIDVQNEMSDKCLKAIIKINNK
mgnify:FL=1